MRIQIIGTVQILIVVLRNFSSGRIDQRCVDLQQIRRLGRVIQAVVDNRSDRFAVRTVGLLFNQRSNGDDFLQVLTFHHFDHFLVFKYPIIEIVQQTAQCTDRFFLHIKLIGIREQIALQTADIAQIFVVDKAVIFKHIIFCRFRQLFHGRNIVLRQQFDDLLYGIAFGDGDRHRRGSTCSRLHGLLQTMIVHTGVKFVNTGIYLLCRTAEQTVEFKEEFGVNDAGFLQLLGNSSQSVAFINGDLGS